MSMSDPIADLLTRIRNAAQAGHPTVEIPASKVKVEICRVMKEEGYIKDYELDDSADQSQLRVSVAYGRNKAPVIQGIQRVSKPSLRVYFGAGDIKPVRSGLGISVISTSRGVMTGKKARQEKIGGEVLCKIW